MPKQFCFIINFPLTCAEPIWDFLSISDEVSGCDILKLILLIANFHCMLFLAAATNSLKFKVQFFESIAKTGATQKVLLHKPLERTLHKRQMGPIL